MKFQLPEHAFPPLVLSAEEQQDLIDEADRIIEDTIAAQEAYCARGRRVAHSKWKHFRAKDGINVYRQRNGGTSKTTLFDPSLAAVDAPFFSRERDSASSTTTASWLPVRDYGAAAAPPPPSSTSSRSGYAFRPGGAAAKTPGASRRPMSTTSSSSMRGGAMDDCPIVMASSPTHSTADTSSASDQGVGWMHTHKPPHIPAILAVGTIDGTLDDAMYGCFSDDDASWRWKSSHINDKLDDARVLATIRGPTKDDPFRFVGVKWFTKEHPSALSSIVKRRDFLIIEAMGTTYDATGKVKLGYFLMHSIEIGRIPVLSDLNMLRGNISFCFILKQQHQQQAIIDVFTRGFSDPQGEMLESVSVRLAAESMLAVSRIVDFAYIKKLRWLMAHRRQNRERHGASASHGNDGTVCKMCHKNANRLSSFLQSSARCQVCHDVVCGKCTVVKQITVDISVAEGATQKAMAFCLSCVMEAKKNVSAYQVALEDVTKKQYDLLAPDVFRPLAQAHAAVAQAAGQKRPVLRRVSTAPRMGAATPHSMAPAAATPSSGPRVVAMGNPSTGTTARTPNSRTRSNTSRKNEHPQATRPSSSRGGDRILLL